MRDTSQYAISPDARPRSWRSESSQFQTVSAASMHVINRLMVNYDTPRQYLNSNWTDFLIFHPRSASRDLQT